MALQGSGKKATNLSLDQDLLKDARALGINVSQAAQNGLEAAVKQAKQEAWVEENRAAMEANNRWVEKNGIPLEKYRMFDV
jgi:antitoxin CcdA